MIKRELQMTSAKILKINRWGLDIYLPKQKKFKNNLELQKLDKKYQ